MQSFINNVYVVLFFLAIQALHSEVLVNQIGYPEVSGKFIFTTSPADSFYVVDSATDAIAFRNVLTLFSSNDDATGLTLYRGDFTDLESPGSYYAQAGSSETSFNFDISNDVYKPVYQAATKSFYFQRCGTALLGEPADPYFHASCHNADAFYHPSTDTTGFNFSKGGWHDAGDFGKYIVNAGITVGTMLMALEEFPERFNRDDLTIPESGNGMPDLVDEIRHELNWMASQQHAGGGVHHKLTAENFSAFIMPEDDSGLRYVYEISSAATAAFAAVMARASRVYAAYDAEFASAVLDMATNAWLYLEDHPAIVPTGGFNNPEGTSTGEYGDSNDQDERLWAAAELFMTTGADTYHEYFLEHYQDFGIFNREMSWPNVGPLAHLTYLRGSNENVDTAVQGDLRAALIAYSQSLLNLRNSTGFQVAMAPDDYVWGSNSVLLNRAILLIFGYEEIGIESYHRAAMDQLHFVLGINAHNISFLTGMGDRSTLFPHNRQSGADGIDPPIPGLLAGGANGNLDDPVLQEHFDSSTPPALAYIDDQGSYGSNENAINWNAPLVFVSGYFAAVEQSTTVVSDSERLPSTHLLLQNYPNPFNPETRFGFRISDFGWVEIDIYDVRGRLVKTVLSQQMNAGNYIASWDGSNDAGGQVASGIYFYQLRVGDQHSDTADRRIIQPANNAFAQTRKMLLIR